MLTKVSTRRMPTEPFQLLSCGIPNSDKRFTFRAVLYAEEKREYLAICSSNKEDNNGKIEGPNLVDRQSVHNLNLKNIPRAYLTVVAFSGTLYQWIAIQQRSDESMMCKLHAGWFCERRPKEPLRRIISGILESTCELHENDTFHGNLDDPKNFAFSLIDDYCGRGDLQHVEVTLLNANNNGSKTKSEIKKGKKKDLKDLHKLILTDMLGFTAEAIAEAKANIEKAKRRKSERKLPVPISDNDLGNDDSVDLNTPKIPRDLIHLWDDMVDMSPDKLREHPGFWNGDRRFHYYARLLSMVFANTHDHPDPVLYEALKLVGTNEFAKDPWRDDIEDELLLPVLKFKGVTYENDMVSLARFAKAVTLHLNDNHDPPLDKMEIDWRLRQTFPDFLVKSFMAMAKNNAFC